MRRSEAAKKRTRLQFEKQLIEIKNNATMLQREVTLYTKYCSRYKMPFACRALKGIKKNLATRNRQIKEHIRKMDKYKREGWI